MLEELDSDIEIMPYITSSQEPLISSQEFRQFNDELKQVMSTQELITTALAIQSQEAYAASEFIETVVINSSQESVSMCAMKNDGFNGNELMNSDGEQSNISFACSTATVTESKSSQNEDNMDESPAKKKRGRKKKVWTQEAWKKHQKELKEKNRLAAKRLRRRKCDEAKDSELIEQTLVEQIRFKKEQCNRLTTKCANLRKLINRKKIAAKK